MLHITRRLQQAVSEAYAKGYLGRNILGSGFDLDIIVHAGAGGAYICGEETALLDSLEGRRGQPRLRPPVPRGGRGGVRQPDGGQQRRIDRLGAQHHRQRRGLVRSMGTEKSKGMTIYSLSGHVANPGQFEAPMGGITLRQLLEVSGGMRAGHQLKFFTPGGSSTPPLLTAEHLDMPLDYEGPMAQGSILGTKALQCFDETTSVVRSTLRFVEFYKHESCGKCTPPCREGTWWLVQLLARLEAGQGGSRATSRSCSTCATTSAAAPSARWPTVLWPVSPRRSSTSGTSSSRATTPPAWELFPYEKNCLFEAAPMKVGGRTDDRGCQQDRRGHLHHRRDRDLGAQGHPGDPGRRTARDPDPEVLRPPAAGPGRRLPPVHGRCDR